jgi:integrase/recombinase XerD
MNVKSTDPRVGKTVIRGKRANTPKRNADYSLDNAFELFYNVKKSEGMRNRTLADYVTHWRYFREWLTTAFPDVETIRNVSVEVMRGYITYMASKRTKYEGTENRELEGVRLSPTTVGIRLKTLRTMFRFLAGETMIDTNPTANLKAPKMDVEDDEVMTEEQFRILIDATNVDTYCGFRDRTLMYTLADGGFRINEAVNLKTEFIDFARRCVDLPAYMNKNRRPRIIPLSHEVIRMLLELITENKTCFGEVEYVFLSNYGEVLKAEHFRHRLTAYAKRTGLYGNVRTSPHRFRHYFCTNFLLNGGSLFALQQVVAHADIKTTQRYVKVNDEAIRSQHDSYSPINRMGLSRIVKRRHPKK